jgi:hypothetical protein
MADTSRKPGLLLVHPRLHDPTPDNAAVFLRWTKLHFRDMLNLPDEGFGRVMRDMRFVAPEKAKGYTHNEEEGLPKYLYTCLVDDIAFLKSRAYDDVSRRLNLERTRALGEEEEAVNGDGEEKMVFDIVDAKFAVFEQTSTGINTFQNLPVHLTSSKGTRPSAPKSCLVVLNISSPSSSSEIPETLQANLLKLFERAPPSLKSYSAVYRWSGKQAQPENHQFIDVEESGEWMVLFLVVDEVGDVLQSEHLVQMVGGWVEQENSKRDEREGVEIAYGVWDGEVFMS